MSYPGGYPPYPPHPQGSGQFPQPYQATTPLSYPVLPGSAAPTGPLSGYPSAPYSSNPLPYPSNTSPYPTSQPSPYPPMNQPSYPSQQPGGYPSSQPGYPPSQQGGYPSAQSGGYPPAQSGGYPPAQSSGYPPAQSGGYPPAQSAGYPPTQSSGYPPQSGGYPPAQSGGYPPAQSSGYPPAQSGGYPSAQPSGYPSSKAGGYPPPQSGHQNPYPSSTPYSHASNGGQTHQSQTQQTNSKGTPTVRPAHPFDPRADAEALRKAMKGFGTDEKTIINVLTKRTNAQRQEIALQFKILYGKDLIKDLKSELSGNFENLIVALMTPLLEFQAIELHNAISGLGTNEMTLVELICTATNQEIRSMCQTYERLYGRTLEEDLIGDTSGSFRRLMVSLCQGRRSENHIIDHQFAVMDAEALLKAGELQLGTDESTFNSILCTRSYNQLNQIFMDYERLAGHSIERAIQKEFSGYIEAGLSAIIFTVKDKAGFFASRLHDIMAGAGTSDRALIRIITLRSEIDLEDIKRAFSHRHGGQSLADYIRADTSGDVEQALISLIG